VKRLKIGGSNEHIYLVKVAAKKLIDAYDLREINLTFEDPMFRMEIKIHTRGTEDQYTNANFDFRPDISARIFKHNQQETFEHKPWKNILDSTWLVFEAEIDPTNIFSNIIKMEAYRKIKSNNYGREVYAFVLVVFDDVPLPSAIEPFDEVWKFPRPPAVNKI